MALLILAGCVPSSAGSAAFRRVDERIDGFTKHYRDSAFQVARERKYSVELLVRSPLAVGNNQFLMIVHDHRDRDVEGAEVSVARNEKDGNRPVDPIKTAEEGGGRYRVSSLWIPDAGPVELLVSIRKQGEVDTASFSFAAKP